MVRRYWFPVWALPPGESTAQRVLQYPVCLLVIAHDYAHLVGPRRGLSTTTLTGCGWALGVMMQPAAGSALWPAGVPDLVDASVPLTQADLVPSTTALIAELRGIIGERAPDAEVRQRAVTRLDEVLVEVLPPADAEGEIVNAIVDHVETDPEVLRVRQVCDKFSITERTLQRLLRRRVGMGPKWLIQRRRLHEAAGALAGPDRPSLVAIATRLGYTDQAHFHRDFQAATGLTPATYAAQPRAHPGTQ